MVFTYKKKPKKRVITTYLIKKKRQNDKDKNYIFLKNDVIFAID